MAYEKPQEEGGQFDPPPSQAVLGLKEMGTFSSLALLDIIKQPFFFFLKSEHNASLQTTN